MSASAAQTAQTRFAAAAGAGHDWQAATTACLDRLGPVEDCTLGFVYVADTLAADMAAVVTMLRATTGIRDWSGSVGIGVLGGAGGKSDGEFFDRPAVAVLATRLRPEDYRRFPMLTEDLSPLPRAAGGWLDRNGAPVAYIHADPRNGALSEVLEALSNDVGAFLVGGMPSSRGAFPQVAVAGSTAIMPTGPVAEGGVSGVFFGQGAGVLVGVSQGCTPVGPRRVITSSHENVMIEIDGRPALDVLKEDIGPELAGDLRRVGQLIHVGRPVAGADTADMLVRNLTGVDPKQGLVGVADLVEEGQTMMFVRRDQAAAEADLRRMLGKLKKRAGGATIKGGLYVTCLARGRNIFGADGDELSIIREELGDVPLAGYFASGEISAGRMYGYTGVLTLFT
jgi:small ligand-binding sensory domain FIST